MICKKCGEYFTTKMLIDGKYRNLGNRSYCLDCSPWGRHNTKKIDRISLVNNDGDEMKKCSICGQYRTLDMFYNKKTENRRDYCCKLCKNDLMMEIWKEKKVKAVQYKGGKCQKCGYYKCVEAMDFHHREPQNKKYDWHKLRLQSWDKIEKELDKCDLLCRNCHCEEHVNLRKQNI